MDPLWIGVAAFLAALLAVVGIWQRRIARIERERAVAEIRDADERGSRKPLAQHPSIEPFLCLGCGSCVAACPEEGVLGVIDGIAHVIHGSRCIGHGRCAEACPVGAITIGLGDVASRPDIPVLTDELETSVPGLFIAGELGGIALIRNAIEQGARAVEAVARRVRAERSGDPGALDLLVVGAGPAGIAASLKAVERGLRFAMIDQEELGGTVRKYPRRKLTMVQPVDLPLHGRLRCQEYRKEELVEQWEAIVREHRIPLREKVRLTGIERQGGSFNVATSDGPIRSRFVVLALGRRGTPRKLGVPGEEAEKVLYQLIDAAGYRDQKLLVVGGGDSAVEAALAFAAQPGNSVAISYRKPAFFRLKARNEERIEAAIRARKIRALFASEVERIEPGEAILALKNGGEEEQAILRREAIPNDYVFVFAGGEPPYPLLRAAGIRLGGEGRPVRSAEART